MGVQMRTADPVGVVVGVNGTAASLAAVRMAAREAVARRHRLRVVHAFSWPGNGVTAAAPRYDELHRQAGEVVDRCVAAARRSMPEVDVEGFLLDGATVRVLLQQSRNAALLVLGDHDLGCAGRLPTDSVLVQCVARARCPVMIARGGGPPSGPVAVGIDGSEAAATALHWAAAEAVRRHSRLDVLHVTPPAGHRAAAQAVLDAAVAAAPEGSGARGRLVTGDEAAALIRAGARAQLLVVGARGTRVGVGTFIGSVARAILHRYDRPTVFVHGAAGPRHEPDGRSPAPP